MTKDKCNKPVKKCCSQLKCKATAALEEQVEAELSEEDKPLEELIHDEDCPQPDITS